MKLALRGLGGEGCPEETAMANPAAEFEGDGNGEAPFATRE